jgi:hypothetical protein
VGALKWQTYLNLHRTPPEITKTSSDSFTAVSTPGCATGAGQTLLQVGAIEKNLIDVFAAAYRTARDKRSSDGEIALRQ